MTSNTSSIRCDAFSEVCFLLISNSFHPLSLSLSLNQVFFLRSGSLRVEKVDRIDLVSRVIDLPYSV